MTSGIEIHDSVLESSFFQYAELVLQLKVYVHRSEGRAGVDSGTGWAQDAKILLAGARVKGRVPLSKAGLSGGDLTLGGEHLSNWISIPCQFTGAVRLKLQFFEYEPLEIEAEGIRLELIGEATYVEEF